jgi:hypothetical protein
MKEIHLIDKQVIINIMDKIEKEYDVDNIKQDSLDAFLHLWEDLKEAIYAKKR